MLVRPKRGKQMANQRPIAVVTIKFTRRQIRGDEVITAIEAAGEELSTGMRGSIVTTKYYRDGEAFEIGYATGDSNSGVQVVPFEEYDGLIEPGRLYGCVQVVTRMWPGSNTLQPRDTDRAIEAAVNFAALLRSVLPT